MISERKNSHERILFASFNQNVSSLCIVIKNAGYSLFCLESLDSSPLVSLTSSTSEEVLFAERLFSSNLIVLVYNSSPKILRVLHFKKKAEIFSYSYSSPILALKLNRSVLVVSTEDALVIHNIRDMSLSHTLIIGSPYQKKQTGLFALSGNSNPCYLAYPSSSSVGELLIFDTVSLRSQVSIDAHTSHLAAIEFSPSGLTIVTASEKGTLIRVFSASDGVKFYEFRRGFKRTAVIQSLSFSPCGFFLAVSSNTETIHIFKLESPSHDESRSDSWMYYLSTMVSSNAAHYLPSGVSDTFRQGRAFATVHHSSSQSISSLALIKNNLRLYVVSQDGFLSIYSLDTYEGGNCSLLQELNLRNSFSSSSSSLGDSSEMEVTYAEKLKNKTLNSSMTADSEKVYEIESALRSPIQDNILFLDDEEEFPPMIPIS